MDILELMKERHSVRQYLDKPIEEEIVTQLLDEINVCNQESGLHIQLIVHDHEAFQGMMPHYGKFKGVQNYIVMVGPKTKDLDEKVGYYGERIVLKAQALGLNSCWVALTFNKRKTQYSVNKGEKLSCVIALGYGETQGIPHKSKAKNELCVVPEKTPAWFDRGMEAVMLAPTALNQQKFIFSIQNEKACVKKTGGFYSQIDLGIVKYHFEMVAGKEHVDWK